MIQKFLLNLVLASVFVALTGSVTFFDFVVGFLIGAGVVSMLTRAAGGPGYLRRIFGLVRFGLYFVWILVKANLDVAREVVTPGYGMQPRLLAYDVSGLTDVELTTLAGAITLTPGTLSADISDDQQTLYIHAMYVELGDGLRNRLMRKVFDHDV